MSIATCRRRRGCRGRSGCRDTRACAVRRNSFLTVVEGGAGLRSGSRRPEATSGSSENALCVLQVFEQLCSALSVDVVTPHRRAGGATPRLAQRAVVDCVEPEIV